MKSIYPILLAAVFLLAACDSSPQSTYVESAPSATPTPRATPLPDVIPKAMADLEKRLEVERQLRVKTESRLVEQETAKSNWQSGALLSVAGAIVLLIVGTCLGTRARHDAKA